MANKTSKGQEGYYARYKSGGVQAKNRKIKLQRALKNQPNNEQIKDALSNIKYRRKKPVTTVWTKSNRALAQVLKEFTGYFDPKILSSNPKTASAALQSLPSRNNGIVIDTVSAQAKYPYSILARVN